MIRWLAVALFVVAVLAFFFVGRIETSKRQRAIESAQIAVTEQIEREYSGAATPDNRIMFLRDTAKTLGSIKKPSTTTIIPAGGAPRPTVPEPALSPAPAPQITTEMPLIITAVFGLFAFGLILAKKQDDDTRKWAFATLGTIVGYWLKG